MPVTWNVYQGGEAANFMNILVDCLVDGAVTEATTEAVTISYNGQSIVFEGDINLNAGEPTAGMANTLRIYDGETLIAEATGYWLDLALIGSTADQLQMSGNVLPLFNMLGLQPITFNGSDDTDVFFDGDFGGVFHGNGGADYFLGGGGEDQLFGDDGKDMLAGQAGDDTLKGGDGADILAGGEGSNLLVGGKGADTYYFTELPGAGEFDTIKGFVHGTDMIELEGSVFAGLGGPGALAAGKFRVGNNAEDANDRIIYKAGTGELFYDSDGVGGVAKIKMAVLANAPDLGAGDFLVG